VYMYRKMVHVRLRSMWHGGWGVLDSTIAIICQSESALAPCTHRIFALDDV
jgi:hypothetical protein